MRKTMLILCVFLCAALCGCRTVPAPMAAATPVPGDAMVMPQAHTDAVRTQETATLYFRFPGEPYLAPESRVVTQQVNQPYEQALIAELLAGPAMRPDGLSALFPAGTRLVSVTRQGRTLFVMFSEELMNPYADEPAAWQDDPYWAVEAPLRRQLCMQSLVATVTENCDVDQVQVLIDPVDAPDGSLRLKQRYFLTTKDDTLLTGPLTRDEALLLTPRQTMQVILTCWQQQDWQRLQRYVITENTAFIPLMTSLPELLRFEVSGGSISPDGMTATYTLYAQMMDADGVESTVKGKILRLTRVDGLWRITLPQLTGWLEVTP